MLFEPGQQVRLPHGPNGWVTVDLAMKDAAGVWTLYVAPDGEETFHKVRLTPEEAPRAEVLRIDGQGSSTRALAGMWTRWMSATATSTPTSIFATSPLRPYAHQTNAVYGAMLPQPRLRFLLADEPGTGKTIMAGLYLQEMRRLGLIRRALVVAPAGLVSKWQADFDRFFGGGLRRITASTVHEDAIHLDHELWIVSLELAAVNAAVQEAIRPDRAGWDLVVFDEAHRLTPTAQSFHRVGRLLATGSPQVLLMTATPHRGSEWLFRHLLHLVDPDVYPDPGPDAKQELSVLRPGATHFLRRMKEDLVDYDGVTHLFRQRHATNHRVPLDQQELNVYTQALELVDQYFPHQARSLARMVYGKRAASCLHALAETLRRRLAHMGGKSPAEAAAEAAPEGDDQETQNEARVTHTDSLAPRAEQSAVRALLGTVSTILRGPDYLPSKWRALINGCLIPNGIRPGEREQAVIFTEYADSAEWIVQRLAADGYTARLYSGRQTHPERDVVRAAFMAGDFQVIVSTDAGNEGIDLQVAHVLVNFDIPWSLVRLEQRMGRIHRVGQTREVELYNLVAADTREGDTLHTLLENFVTAANELDGKMFDSLSLVAELASVSYEEWLQTLYGDDELKKAEVLAAVRRVSAVDLQRQAEQTRDQEARLATEVDVQAGLTRLHQDSLDRLNPSVVQAYLRRLSAADIVRAQHTAAGEGIMLITADRPLPPAMGGTDRALVATSNEALSNGPLNTDGSRPVPLGPGHPAFTALATAASETCAPDVYRGGTVQDSTAPNAYHLFAFASELTSSASHTPAPWSTLIRVDANGDTRQIRWEILANLVPTEQRAEPPSSVHTEVATSEARRLLKQAVAEQRKVRSAWFAAAKRDLANLPIDLTTDIRDRSTRIKLRDQLTTAAEQKLVQMEMLCQVDAVPPRLVARLHVVPGKDGGAPERRQADAVAVSHVHGLLAADGWMVTNVHATSHGFDLRAVREQEQRVVAAKGVWRTIDTGGVQVHGNELLMASQHRDDYWLYVVEQCHDGSGELFGVFPDPLDTFAENFSGEALARLPATALHEARQRASTRTDSVPARSLDDPND